MVSQEINGIIGLNSDSSSLVGKVGLVCSGLDIRFIFPSMNSAADNEWPK